MRTWVHSLTVTGKHLRQVINDGGEDLQSCKNTLEALQTCYENIKRLVSEDDWDWYFEDAYANIIVDLEILNDSNDARREDRLIDIGYDGYNPALEMTNNELRTFYDLCDEHSIWIGL